MLSRDFAVHLQALDGARASSTLTLTVTSNDPRYNEKTFTTSVAVTPIAVVPPGMTLPDMFQHAFRNEKKKNPDAD